MKLLFSTSEEFSREFKEALGYVDANFPLMKIRPDLRNATRELITLIGQETYDEIRLTYDRVKHHRHHGITESRKNILILAQNAVANMAYRNFAPSNDLQHGVNGRKMLTSDESKTPFEHMIVASNDELDRRTNRALDDLIDALDKGSRKWKRSEEFKKTHRLFVRTTTEFDMFYEIGSRFLLQKLSPGLYLSEKREILSRIGQERFDNLKEKRNRTNRSPLTDDEKTLLLLIQEATVYSALAWGIVRLQPTFFPDGIYQSIRSERLTISGKVALGGNKIDQLAQRFSADAARTLREIEKAVAPPPDPTDYECPDHDKFGYSINDKFVT